MDAGRSFEKPSSSASRKKSHTEHTSRSQEVKEPAKAELIEKLNVQKTRFGELHDAFSQFPGTSDKLKEWNDSLQRIEEKLLHERTPITTGCTLVSKYTCLVDKFEVGLKQYQLDMRADQLLEDLSRFPNQHQYVNEWQSCQKDFIGEISSIDNIEFKREAISRYECYVSNLANRLLKQHEARADQLLEDFLHITHKQQGLNRWLNEFSSIRQEALDYTKSLDSRVSSIKKYASRIKDLEKTNNDLQDFYTNNPPAHTIKETASTSSSYSKERKREHSHNITKHESNVKQISKDDIELKDLQKGLVGKSTKPDIVTNIEQILTNIYKNLKEIPLPEGWHNGILNKLLLRKEELRRYRDQVLANSNLKDGKSRKEAIKILEMHLKDLKEMKESYFTDKNLYVKSGADTIEKNSPNQDSYSCNEKHRVYAVFDGMGGYAGGNVASNIAKIHLESNLHKLSNNVRLDKIKNEIKAMLTQFHKKIQAQQKGYLSKMGSTASVVKIMKNGIAVIGNIGDSRVYRFNAESLSVEHLTLDDSKYTYEQINQGTSRELLLEHQKCITNIESIEERPKNIPSEAFTNRHMLSQALGRDDHGFKPNISTYQLLPGDRLIIMSDGIHDNLTDQQISECLVQNPRDTQKAAQALVQRAKDVSQQGTAKSKADDTTAVVVDL